MGELVKEATTHLSTLLRSEVELAKAELTAEVRKGVKGSIMFIVAFAILIFSLFFLFIALGEVIDVWLPRWAAFTIVFGLMLLAAGGFALFGWRRVKSLRKPERTITTVKETGEVFTHLRPNHQHDGHPRSGVEPGTAPASLPAPGAAQPPGPRREHRYREPQHPDQRRA
ncbi:MAG TPA: phage holin family protein [Pseudonocardiaceae bacterium]|nr:phage holin family protein [Pseudonocardiaceae bacterium]